MQFATPTSSLLVRSQPHAAPSGSLPAKAVAALFGTPGLSSRAIVTALGVALFVDLIIIAVEAATVWSVAGLLHLPATATVAFALVLFVPAKWLCWKVAKLALEAERDAGIEA